MKRKPRKNRIAVKKDAWEGVEQVDGKTDNGANDLG
jgi:hypothetical protein